MIIQREFQFSKQQAITGTSDVVSTDVYDAGAAVILFSGDNDNLIIQTVQTASGGTNPTMRIRLVGADNAGLTTNPIIIDESGVSAVLTAGDLPRVVNLKPAHQRVPKRFYGIIYLQGGTSPTATINAHLSEANQGAFLATHGTLP